VHPRYNLLKSSSKYKKNGSLGRKNLDLDLEAKEGKEVKLLMMAFSDRSICFLIYAHHEEIV
jgi:hypothetical protein